MKDNLRAGIIAAVIVILFSSYGVIYTQMKGVELGGIDFGRHRILAPITLVLFGWVCWRVVIMERRRLESMAIYANLIGLALLIMPVAQIVFNLDKIKLPSNHKPSLTGSIPHCKREFISRCVLLLVG